MVVDWMCLEQDLHPGRCLPSYPIPDFPSRPRHCSFVEMMTNQAQTPVKSPVKFQLSHDASRASLLVGRPLVLRQEYMCCTVLPMKCEFQPPMCKSKRGVGIRKRGQHGVNCSCTVHQLHLSPLIPVLVFEPLVGHTG